MSPSQNVQTTKSPKPCICDSWSHHNPTMHLHSPLNQKHSNIHWLTLEKWKRYAKLLSPSVRPGLPRKVWALPEVIKVAQQSKQTITRIWVISSCYTLNFRFIKLWTHKSKTFAARATQNVSSWLILLAKSQSLQILELQWNIFANTRCGTPFRALCDMFRSFTEQRNRLLGNMKCCNFQKLWKFFMVFLLWNLW